MSTPIINFSYNWNNKLNCKAFTTFKLKNVNKYQIGKEYNILLKKQLLKSAIIEDIKTIYFNQINEFIARVDTGYSAEETKNILKKMYSKINIETQPFSFILLSTVK